MSGRSIDDSSTLGYNNHMDCVEMPIDYLIKHLEIIQNEYPTATCSIGANPKCLLVKMGCKAVMLKLDGDCK